MSVTASPRPEDSLASAAARSGPSRPPRARRRARWLGLALALMLLAISMAASLAVGSLQMSPSTVFRALTGGQVAAADHAAVVDLRLPRTMVALAVGIGLGGAGALVQALTRNPLADPGVLGVTSGSGFAVAIATAFCGVTAPSGYLWFALAGALLTTLVVIAVGSAGSRGPSPEQLLLAGIALSAVLAGIVSAIRLSDPRRFESLQIWAAGSVRDRGWSTLMPAVPAIAVGVVLAILLAGGLNALALGEDRALALGASVTRTRIGTVFAVTLLAGGATAVAGPIAFVGLMVPHVARRIAGPDQRWIIGLSLVLAPILLIVSDIVARLVLWPGEVPVGLVTAFLGAPMLIALVRRGRVSQL